MGTNLHDCHFMSRQTMHMALHCIYMCKRARQVSLPLSDVTVRAAPLPLPLPLPVSPPSPPVFRANVTFHGVMEGGGGNSNAKVVDALGGLFSRMADSFFRRIPVRLRRERSYEMSLKTPPVTLNGNNITTVEGSAFGPLPEPMPMSMPLTVPRPLPPVILRRHTPAIAFSGQVHFVPLRASLTPHRPPRPPALDGFPTSMSWSSYGDNRADAPHPPIVTRKVHMGGPLVHHPPAPPHPPHPVPLSADKPPTSSIGSPLASILSPSTREEDEKPPLNMTGSLPLPPKPFFPLGLPPKAATLVQTNSEKKDTDVAEHVAGQKDKHETEMGDMMDALKKAFVPSADSDDKGEGSENEGVDEQQAALLRQIREAIDVLKQQEAAVQQQQQQQQYQHKANKTANPSHPLPPTDPNEHSSLLAVDKKKTEVSAEPSGNELPPASSASGRDEASASSGEEDSTNEKDDAANMMPIELEHMHSEALADTKEQQRQQQQQQEGEETERQQGDTEAADGNKEETDTETETETEADEVVPPKTDDDVPPAPAPLENLLDEMMANAPEEPAPNSQVRGERPPASVSLAEREKDKGKMARHDGQERRAGGGGGETEVAKQAPFTGNLLADILATLMGHSSESNK
ncbi:unnamed protein product [Vitrella brassicaformis CCMP3155]|uniref:Uncharacterized protein n=1 Tax=Vitrella brassicaformis (strain CCMP3155) TaxID=1169540 RepID=A0A0G4GZK0_VITBC|nr:unnamed protein product [Vitrella brassicaformis CCMP3155]|eukprot:CEM36584.1 unnamed protein product [Vitrella brassicaformis CCMP3155]